MSDRPAGARPPLLGELAVLALLLFAYDRIAALAHVQTSVAVTHGRAILAAEQQFGTPPELVLDQLVAAHRLLGQALAVYYDFAHGLVTTGVLLALYATRCPGYRRARRALVGTNAIALVVFFLLPVAPPRLLPGARIVDVVAASHTWGAWEVPTSAVAAHADVLASLPSLHTAWAVWVLQATIAAGAPRPVRLLAAGHTILTVLVVLATGNHYCLDVLAGAAATAVCWCAAGRPATREPVHRHTGPIPGVLPPLPDLPGHDPLS